VPSPPLLSSSGDVDDGESGDGESSLRFRPCNGPPAPIFIPPEDGPYNQSSTTNCTRTQVSQIDARSQAQSISD